MSYTIRTTTAFIVSVIGRGEADLVVHALTEDFGLISALAQGVRLGKSKLKPFLLPYEISSISLVRGRDYWRVVNAESFISLSEKNINFKKKNLKERAYIALLIKRLIHGEEYKPKVFAEVFAFLIFLLQNNINDNHIKQIMLIAEFRILLSLGYIGKEKGLEEFYAEEFVWNNQLFNNKLPIVKLEMVIKKALHSSQL